MRTMPKKDPNALLDYTWDWGPWLAKVGDAIASYEVAIDVAPDSSLVVDSHARDAGVVTAWLRGGTVGQVYVVRCRITTNAGRTDDRSFMVEIASR